MPLSMMKIGGAIVALIAIAYGVYNIEMGTYRAWRRPVRIVGGILILIACIIRFVFMRD